MINYIKNLFCKHSWKELTEIYPNNSKACVDCKYIYPDRRFSDSNLRVRYAVCGYNTKYCSENNFNNNCKYHERYKTMVCDKCGKTTNC